MIILRFKSEFLPLIRQGKKTQTIRNFNRKCPFKVGDEVNAVDNKDRGIKIRITEIYKKNAAEITQEEARLDGFENVERLKDELTKIYGTLNFDATIIRFHLN